MADPAPAFRPPSLAEVKAQVVDLTDGIDAVRPSGTQPFVAGFFADEASFRAAVRAVRALGHADLQAWTPYPVHGLDDDLGLRRSLIGRPVFAVALAGFAACFLMQFHFMVEDWPTIYGGKPYYNWPLWVVPTLETGLLFAAIVNLLLAFKSCRLLPDPAARTPDPRLTDDLFCLAIAPGSQGADVAALESLLAANGAQGLRRIDPVDARAEPVFAPWREPAPALRTLHRDSLKDGAHHG